MFSVFLSVHRGGRSRSEGPPRLRSESRPGAPLVKVRGAPWSRSSQGQGPGGPLVKVWEGLPLVKVQVTVQGGWWPPWSRSGAPLVKVQVKVWGPPGQGPGQGASLVKVQVKVWGPPGQGPGQGPGGPARSRSRSRSGGPPGQGPGQGPGPPLSRSSAPLVKVQVKVQGAPWSRSGSRSGPPGQGPGQGPGTPPGKGPWAPPVKVQKCGERGRYASCGLVEHFLLL